MKFRELIKYLSADHFMPCFRMTLEQLTELVVTYQKVSDWHAMDSYKHIKQDDKPNKISSVLLSPVDREISETSSSSNVSNNQLGVANFFKVNTFHYFTYLF